MKIIFPLMILPLIMAGCADTGIKNPLQNETPSKPVAAKQSKPKTVSPTPDDLLNVRSKCTTTDAIETVSRLDLHIKSGVVQTFDLQVKMKEYGICRFNLTDFEQLEKTPQVVLRNRRESGCTISMAEQGNHVKIFFNHCPKSCEGVAFTYLWPVIINAKTGRCAGQ